MSKTVQFGIGFVTGRPNVCKVINNTYEQLIEQFKNTGDKVELTIFILFDLEYQYTTRVDFYGLMPNVYKDIKIKYITPEDIAEMKKRLIGKGNLTKSEADLFFGHGHAKGRNTLMYYALIRNMDYLLFWDDDEYPVACVKSGEKKEIMWQKQDNVAKHYQYIQNADITIGYHCGYISPIPYVELNEEVDEKLFGNYIEAISNDIISWASIKEKFIKDNGITYADEEIAQGKNLYEIEYKNGGKWVAGSTLCLNLNHIDKIPAFYNPEGARGEDTFFSTKLKDAKVLKIPVYHFHDGFLKYSNILHGKYPKTLRRIKIEDEQIAKRFIQASRGWVKYKPLFEYITTPENYKEKMSDITRKLQEGVPEINKLFGGDQCNILLDDLKNYNKNVKKHYDEYLRTNEIWDRIKKEAENG